MRYAVVSDIHGNLQAWQAVLRDIETLGVDSTICLGDIVGYGPRPAEVFESVWEHADHFLLGNHDAVVAGQLNPEIFSDHAKRMIDWTMKKLDPTVHDLLTDLPYIIEGQGFTLSHAELAQPDRFAYIDNEQDAAENFSTCEEPVLFVGHSHVPRIFVLHEASGEVGELPVHDFAAGEGQRYIVNVGSVGDPRDGRTLASYCIYDSDKQSIFHRSVEFDIEAFRTDFETFEISEKPWFLVCWDRQGAGSRRVDDWSRNVRTVVRPKKRIVIRRMQSESEEIEQEPFAAEPIQDGKETLKANAREEVLSGALAEKLRKQKVEAAEARKRKEAEEAEQAEIKAEVLRKRKLELAEAVEERKKAKLKKREELKRKKEAERERVRQQIEMRRRLAAEKNANRPDGGSR